MWLQQDFTCKSDDSQLFNNLKQVDLSIQLFPGFFKKFIFQRLLSRAATAKFERVVWFVGIHKALPILNALRGFILGIFFLCRLAAWAIWNFLVVFTQVFWVKFSQHTVIYTEIRKFSNKTIWNRSKGIKDCTEAKKRFQEIQPVVVIFKLCIGWRELENHLDLIDIIQIRRWHNGTIANILWNVGKITCRHMVSC